MHFESVQGDLEFRFALDFGAERIQFDLFRDVGVRDTGTAGSAEHVHEVKRFEQDYFGNGRLHIVNTDTGELIGRKDAYLPVNKYLDREGAAAELAYWKALAEQRRSASRNKAMTRSATRGLRRPAPDAKLEVVAQAFVKMTVARTGHVHLPPPLAVRALPPASLAPCQALGGLGL